MYKVGITGNIGSGKSTICRLFSVLGIPVYHADERAKWLLENRPEMVASVTSLLGKEAYQENGKLNRNWIAAKVFANAELLQQYNHIIHPAVLQDGDVWMNAHTHAPYTIKEAALLFETGSYKQLDYVVCVTAPENIRLQRIMDRDRTSEDAAKARMQHQMPEEKKTDLADAIIINDGNHPLIPQVWNIHHQLIQRLGLRL
jgi:dephospho-CoA kinase